MCKWNSLARLCFLRYTYIFKKMYPIYHRDRDSDSVVNNMMAAIRTESGNCKDSVCSNALKRLLQISDCIRLTVSYWMVLVYPRRVLLWAELVCLNSESLSKNICRFHRRSGLAMTVLETSISCMCASVTWIVKVETWLWIYLKTEVVDEIESSSGIG